VAYNHSRRKHEILARSHHHQGNLFSLLSEVSKSITQVAASNPAFKTYCGKYAIHEDLLTYIRYVRGLMMLGKINLETSVVLDAGCGFGFPAVVLSLPGVREVEGVEFQPDWVATGNRLKERLVLILMSTCQPCHQ